MSECRACEQRLNLGDSNARAREQGLVLVSADNTLWQGQAYDADLDMRPGDVSTRSETKRCPDCGRLWHVTEDFEAGYRGYWCEPVETN